MIDVQVGRQVAERINLHPAVPSNEPAPFAPLFADVRPFNSCNSKMPFSKRSRV